MQNRKLYVNAKQKEVLDAIQKIKVFQAGRGTGKTTIRGDRYKRLIHELPKSKGFLLGKTFKMIQDNFLPEIFDRLLKYGIKEHVSDAQPGHYVINRKPPEWWWQPYKKPRNYENKISFINGMVIYLMSFDRPDTVRGGSFDFGDIDEAQDIDYTKFKKTALPLLRGNKNRWASNLHGSLFITGSMPWTERGFWLIEKMPELAQQFPDEYLFIESSAEDNRAVLGNDYFKRMKQMMDPITYSVEIENKRVDKIPNCFYPALNESHLIYPVFTGEMDYLDDYADVIKTQTLEISFDFNAAFNSCLIGQEHQDRNHCIDVMWVKHKSFEYLIENVCDKYSFMKTRMIYIYGGKDGKKGNANSDLTYYQQIQNKLAELGWDSMVLTEIGLADGDHKVKQLVINTVLSNSDGVKPITMHDTRCQPLYLSMLQTPILPDFRKDKSSEKADIPQERATHLSDCFDNWIYPKYHRVVENRGASSLSPFFS
uniref:hypothetical protein n=1 Tax=Roseivirga sp. TaxID=1964215 RepID=UPI004047EACF